MSGRRRPLIAHVAAAAGVSPTTVSHVYSGRRPVRRETADVVKAAAHRLGYVPHHPAQSLARGSSRTLGLVVADVSSSYFGELAKGVDDAAHDLGFSVLLANTNWDREREASAIRLLTSGHTDGLIYGAGGPLSVRRLRRLMLGSPIVVVDESIRGLNADEVVSDNRAGGRLVGEHLAALGHASALYLGGPEGLATSRERLAGFEEGFSASGRRPVRIRARYADYRLEGARTAVDSEMAVGLDWTAIFAGNDLMAVGAIEALTQGGYRTPQDVSVAGFDDTILARHFHPRLTTVRQHAYELGRVAAETLVSRILRKEVPSSRRVVLGVELLIGKSTGRAADPSGPGSAGENNLDRPVLPEAAE